MATWQFEFLLLPASGVERRFPTMPLTLSVEEYDRVNWWQDVDLRRELEEDISRLLPCGHSWHSELRTWGAEDGNRLDLWLTGDHIAEVHGRVDLRALSLPFLSGVIEMVRCRGLLMVTEARHVLGPSIEELLAAIHRSPSFAFVTDPEAFLRNLARGDT